MSVPDRLTFIRWETPFTDNRGVTLVSLVQDLTLKITLQNVRDPLRKRYQIEFPHWAIYRSTPEDLRTGEPDCDGPFDSPTRIAVQSPWLEELRQRESLLDVLYAGCRHFIVVTEDEILEVLSSSEPVLSDVGSAPLDAPRPGRSQVAYMDEPDGQARFEGLLAEIRSERDSGSSGS
jgi:hypothetical protein